MNFRQKTSKKLNSLFYYPNKSFSWCCRPLLVSINNRLILSLFQFVHELSLNSDAAIKKTIAGWKWNKNRQFFPGYRDKFVRVYQFLTKTKTKKFLFLNKKIFGEKSLIVGVNL